jgi:hypothetical protein
MPIFVIIVQRLVLYGEFSRSLFNTFVRGFKKLIVVLHLSSMRMFNNEDVTIGSWMLALNVEHEDDRKLCSTECTQDSIAVWDLPTCSGEHLLLLDER